MLTDLILASLHHLLFLAIIAMLATESAVLRGRVDAATIGRLAGVDAGYGLCAMALLAGLISIRPTLAFLRWRKALRADAGYVPDAGQVQAIARLVRVELALLAAIVVLAAMMARYGGF